MESSRILHILPEFKDLAIADSWQGLKELEEILQEFTDLADSL